MIGRGGHRSRNKEGDTLELDNFSADAAIVIVIGVANSDAEWRPEDSLWDSAYLVFVVSNDELL